ncbi:MAG: phosphohistidine phosphatase SixA [Ignavibacteriaceae bacterium]
MNIYLIRHGDAENSSSEIKDSERKLTAKGKEKMGKAVAGWKNIITHFDYVISSPFLRALQTAKIIAKAYEIDEHKLIIDKRLKSGSTTEDVIEISNAFEAEDIAFVGHQPEFAEHVSKLVSDSGAYFEFKKGAIAKIVFFNKVKEGKGSLEFLIPPNIFK